MFFQRDMRSQSYSSMAAVQTDGLDEEDLGSIEVWEKLAVLAQEDKDVIQQGDSDVEDIELWVQAFLGRKDPPGHSKQELLSRQVASLVHAAMNNISFEAVDVAAAPHLALPYQLPGDSKQLPTLLNMASSQRGPSGREQKDRRFLCNRLPPIPEDSFAAAPCSADNTDSLRRAEGHRCYTSI
eukprot:TRINITY_DN36852_c0_g1_i1.p1 TRINITY_DN36852_c0_g1~~TRINITY_DN36852_c0_g1_i1.p1  ORF type:complete len:183 (+),score=31.75 TRINITY_DN36852_c0_g1_i1:113-661(+)